MDRPVYGMMTNPSRNVVEEIRAASRMGFDYAEINIEIPCGHPDILKRERLAILKALKKFEHPPVAHTAYWFDLCSDYEEVRQAWLSVAMKSVDAASLLGCGIMNIHAPILRSAYVYVDAFRKRALRNMVRSLRELVRYASGRDVAIMLENMPDLGGVRFKEFSCILDGVPGLMAHVDTAHAFVEGGMPMVSRYLRTFQERLVHIHFSDNMGLEDEHLGIGQGVMDYARVMRLLKRMRYDRTITLEIYSSMKDLRDSLRIVRAIEEGIW